MQYNIWHRTTQFIHHRNSYNFSLFYSKATYLVGLSRISIELQIYLLSFFEFVLIYVKVSPNLNRKLIASVKIEFHVFIVSKFSLVVKLKLKICQYYFIWFHPSIQWWFVIILYSLLTNNNNNLLDFLFCSFCCTLCLPPSILLFFGFTIFFFFFFSFNQFLNCTIPYLPPQFHISHFPLSLYFDFYFNFHLCILVFILTFIFLLSIVHFVSISVLLC